MIIYFIIFFLFLFSTLLNLSIKVSYIYSYLFFLILFIFGSIRYEIGMDYISYSELFNEIIPNFEFNLRITDTFSEPGYVFIIKILKYFGFNNVGLFAIHIFISLYFVNKAILKYSKNLFLSWLIFFGVYYINLLFNGIRQGLMISILLYFVPIIFERGKKNISKVILLTFILTFFIHKTALVLPILYLLSYLNFNTNKKIYIVILSCIWAYSGIGDSIVQLTHLDFVKNSSLLSVLDVYSVSENTENTIGFFSISMLHRLVFLFLGLYFAKYLSNPIHLRILNLYFWGVILYILLVPLGYMIATRLSMNFKIFDIITLSYFIYYLKENEFKFSYVIFIATWSLSVMLTNFYLPGNYEFYIPFKTIF
jgi:hypothetical protein